MDIIHAYAHPRKRKDANCTTCRFAEPTHTIGGKDALLCTERMYDDKEHRCYLPREDAQNETP